MILNRIYYSIKPLVPRSVQISLRRQIAYHKRKKYRRCWPISESAGNPPAGWTGWPEGKKFALVLSHDVDTRKGHDICMNLAKLEEKLGFRSSFNFVPERYKNSNSLHRDLREKGFEIGVHGLKHDGKLFNSRKIFVERSTKINHYLMKWNAKYFTSPSMHHNLDWLHALNILYSTSTFDTDPFEPQPDGVDTIFPFWVQSSDPARGYLEIPSTMPQDHLLFVILGEKSIDIWKEKLDWIAGKGGMVLLNTHSDYMNFSGRTSKFEEYPIDYYSEFLGYIRDNYHRQYWNALPNEIAYFWKENKLQNPEFKSSLTNRAIYPESCQLKVK